MTRSLTPAAALLVSALLLLGGPALAQGAGPPATLSQPPSQAPAQLGQPPAPAAERPRLDAARPEPSASVVGQAGSPFLPAMPEAPQASNLIDLEVRDPAGARVGEIQDVLFDGSLGVRGFVVGFGGFRGGNARVVALAPAALTIRRAPDGKWAAVLNLPLSEIEAAPPFAYTSGFNVE